MTDDDGDATLSVSNVGGIDSATVTFEPGVSVLAGRNATNRTSLLRSLMAVLGSDDVSLKGDADEGRVELDLGGETYTRTLRRTADGQALGGDPYLDDPTVADLFAFLLETNDARQAVARQEDLRDLVMEPVDTEDIQQQIEAKQAERREVEDRLDDLDSLRDRLPELEARRRDLEAEIEETEAELDDVDVDAGQDRIHEQQEEEDELDETLEQLRDRREQLQSTRFEIETERESLAALEEEREEVEDRLDDLEDADSGRAGTIEDRLDDLRARRQSLNTETSKLQTVIQLNEELLEGDDSGLNEDLRGIHADGGTADAPTEQLLAGDQTVCWTCGSEVAGDAIEETIESLRDIRSRRVQELREIEDDISQVQEQRKELESRLSERDRLERRLKNTADEIDDREERIEQLDQQKEALGTDIEELEAEADRLQESANSELLERHREANELEFELSTLQDDLAGVEDEIADVEAELDREEELEEQKETLQEAVEELRTRIDRLEREMVDAFNEHMATVLDLLEYENLERVWLEKRHATVREGRRNVERTVFELHIVRSTDDGTTYEDTIDHLSESEREVTGLIFGLAGFLVHDVHETVPFVLLDSLEAIDAQRIAKLVEYFEDHADFLLVALLPEDARALDDAHSHVSEF